MKKRKESIEMSEPVAVRFPAEEYAILSDKAREVGLSPGLYVRAIVLPVLRQGINSIPGIERTGTEG